MKFSLIVDDEPLIRASVSKKVEESCEATVVSGSAGNGSEALEWLENNYADICITDVRMPVMDGLELIRNINTRYPWMVCLIISSYNDFDYARQGIKLGVVDYILKPVDQALLKEAVENACMKADTSRLDQARDILLNLAAGHRRVLDKWVEMLRHGKPTMNSDIIGETMNLLKASAEGKSWLLEAFSTAWLKIVNMEMGKEGVLIQGHVETELNRSRKTITRAEEKDYFEECARNILQTGMEEIYRTVGSDSVKRSHRYVEEIKEYIRENYKKAITLQELADLVEMSRTYISGSFKNETGMTIWKYLLDVRMEKAAELLKTTSYKVYEVGFQVGYDNSMHFSQVFKDYFGVSPAEYKKS